MNHVWSLDLPPTTKYVAVALADHAHDDGLEARPSQDYLSRKTGISVRHVRRCLHDLVERRVIYVERPAARGRCTVYGFTPPEGGFGRSLEPVKNTNGRSSGSNGRSSGTVWAVTHDPLIINNRNDKKAISYSDDVRRQTITDIRALLRPSS